MTNEWYYAKAGKKEGPVSIDDLKRLVQHGQLQPTDHVWKQGMAAWVPASTVEGLFGTEPPPLPPSVSPSPQPLHRPSTSPSPSTKNDMADWLRWLDTHKIVISVVCAVVGISLAFISRSFTRNDSIRTLFAIIGLVPGCTFGIIWAINRQKKDMLHGLWEPVSGDGVYFQFTKDGALVRGDGVATRYRWLSNDKIELYTDAASPKVEIEILSLSKMELIVRADGQGGHFKKGMTVTQAEAEAQAEAARQAAWGAAGAIAKGAGMLALGGLAVLGGIAAGAAVATGGGGSVEGGGSGASTPPKPTGPQARKCATCKGSGWRHDTDPSQGYCRSCAGRGVVYD